MKPRLLVAIGAFLSMAAEASPSPDSGSLPEPDPPPCDAPEWTAVRHAVDTWCDGRSPVERRYYDWSLKRTRRRACADLRAGLGKCTADLWDADKWQSDGKPGSLVVIAELPTAEATYWEVHMVPRGNGYRVTSVDFMEDCTGP
jgi:hypothetical protein